MTTKEAIFNEALHLFSHQGYDVTSIREITGRIKLTESSFYNHYRSKKDLLLAILSACDDFFTQESLPPAEYEKWAEQYSLREIFDILLDRFFKMLEKPQALVMWQLVVNEQFRTPEAREIILNVKKSRTERTCVIFEALQEQGKMKRTSSQRAASLYVNSMYSILSDYLVSLLHHDENNGFAGAIGEVFDTLMDLYKNEQ